MKTGRLIVTYLMILCWEYDVEAQQKPVISQYMFNGLVLNPAYAGTNGYFSATGMLRNQWVNLEGAPRISTLAMHSNIKNKNIGLGLVVTNDQIGVHNDMSAYLSYAYHLKLPVGTLSMGLQTGFNNLTSSFNELTLSTASDPILNDQITRFKINFGTGLYYFTENFYAGFSIPYIIKNRTFKQVDIIRSIEESRYYYFTIGKVITLNKNFKFKPSGLLRIEEGMPVAYDLSANIFIDDAINVGLSYREEDSIIGMFEIQLNDYLRFGYAYDWIISELSTYTQGTHELMVNYRLNLFAPKHHKMCPGPVYF